MPWPFRIDVDSLPALIMGAVLLAGAVVMSMKQWWAHRRLTLNSKVDEAGYAIAERQIRNRLLVGGLMFVVGVAVPLGDQLDFFFRVRPAWFFAYWMTVLLLVFVMVLLSIGDVLSTLAYIRISQGQLRQERKELEEEIRRYRASKQASGADEAKRT